MHEVGSRIRKGLIVEFDEIENAGDVGKIEREFEVFECQGACLPRGFLEPHRKNGIPHL